MVIESLLYYQYQHDQPKPCTRREIPPKVTIGNRLSHPRPSNFCLWLSGSFEWTSEAQRSEAQQLFFPKFPSPVGTVISKNPTDPKNPRHTDDITNCRNFCSTFCLRKFFEQKKRCQRLTCAFHILPNLESLSAAIWTPFDSKAAKNSEA